MRILLDENLPRKLTGHLVSHACQTVVECGWAGKKNGELLGLADPQFDVLLTLAAASDQVGRREGGDHGPRGGEDSAGRNAAHRGGRVRGQFADRDAIYDDARGS